MSEEWLTPEQIRQRRAAEIMEAPLGVAILKAVSWTRRHWPTSGDDEIFLHPDDEGASVLIGGRLMGYPVKASVGVPRGGALVFCRISRAYVRDGQKPDVHFVNPVRPGEEPTT